jgi:crotonobetainyl-CoA:carnitine CoA-transferase CaiB-like acyl-CoA transferase
LAKDSGARYAVRASFAPRQVRAHLSAATRKCKHRIPNPCLHQTDQNWCAVLTEIEVLELADERAGFCTRILALMGARVIKIEPPGGGPARRRGPFIEDIRNSKKSLTFSYQNTNKLGITLDLSQPQGQKLFRKLVRKADVFVETFSPDAIKKFSCAYEELNNVNPRLIHASVSGFGGQGPRSHYQSCALVAAAYSGSMSINGSPETSPLKPGGEQSHFAGSLFAALGILLALRQRRKTGRGEHIDLSLHEAMTATLEHVMIRYFHDQITAKRQGSHPGDNGFSILPCRDGFIQITVFQQWETLVGWLAADGMAGDLEEDRWQDETYRRLHAEHITDVIREWTQSHSVRDLFEKGQLMGFPWAPVQSPMEVLENPQLQARDFFIPLYDEATGKTMSCPGLPFRYTAKTLPSLKSAPAAGGDNMRIYRDELGLAGEELSRLAAEGII